MALKDLIYKIKYEVEDKDLKNSDKNIESLEKRIKELEKGLIDANDEIKKMSKNTGNVENGFIRIKDILASKLIMKGIDLVGKGIETAKNLTLDLLQTASDAQESISKFEIVFGSLSDATFKWIDDTAESIERGRGDLRRYLADTQTLFFGYTDQSERMREVTAEMSKSVVKFALDLAAMNDVADDDVISSLHSGLLGNHLALKNLGVALNDTTLKMTMQRLGIKGNFQNLDELTKIQVRYITALEQSQTAIGHAERESEGYTSQVKALQGEITDIKEELGIGLIPVAIDFIKVVRENKDVIVDLGNQFVEFVSVKGKKAIDWFKDTKNIENFKDKIKNCW